MEPPVFDRRTAWAVGSQAGRAGPHDLPAAEPHWTAGGRVVRPPVAGCQFEPDGFDSADILEGRNRSAQDEGECQARGAAQGALRGADRDAEGGRGSVANRLGIPVVQEAWEGRDAHRVGELAEARS